MRSWDPSRQLPFARTFRTNCHGFVLRAVNRAAPRWSPGFSRSAEIEMLNSGPAEAGTPTPTGVAFRWSPGFSRSAEIEMLNSGPAEAGTPTPTCAASRWSPGFS